MSKVKQILAGVLSASMIVTLMPAVTFADGDVAVTAGWTAAEPVPTATAYTGNVDFDATVTIKHGSNTYTPVQVEDTTSLQTAVNQAVAGDVVDIDGDIVLTADLALWAGKTLANDETIALDLTDAGIYELITTDHASYTGYKLTTPFASVAQNGDVYTYANLFYDASNMTINFPTEYVSGDVNGVTLSFKMANEKVYTAKTYKSMDGETVAGYYAVYDDGTTPILVDGTSNGFAIYVEELGTGATCTTEGSEILHAYVTSGWKTVGEDGKTITNLLDESTKDYGTLAPLGHAYVTPASRIVDGVFELPNYTVDDKGSTTAYEGNGYGVFISWAIRGKDANVIKSVDAEGNTAIDSVKAKCLNKTNHGIGTEAPDWTNVADYEIIGVEAGTPATSTAAGSTIYTVSIETADGANVVVKQRVYDIPGLEASTIGRLTEMTFETGVYKYIEDTNTYELQDTDWLPALYAEYTPMGSGDNTKIYKTLVADDGAINYRISYADAISNTGNGKLTGTLTPSASIAAKTYANTDKLTTSTPECGMNKFYYEPVKVNVVKTAYVGKSDDEVTNDEYVKSTEYVYVGATTNDMTTVTLEDTISDVDGIRTINRVGDSATKTAVYPFAIVVPKNGYTCTANHTFDMNDGTYDITEQATTYKTGKATITCKYCGQSEINVVLPRLTTNVLYVNKAEDAATAADDTANAHVYVVEPTCTTAGYSYYRAIESYAKYKPNDKTTYAEVVIEGSQKDALGHDWYIASQSDVKWTGNSICEITYRCKHAKTGEVHATRVVTYYAAKGTDVEGDYTAKKYSAISKATVKAEDCTANDRIVYTVDGIEDVLGNKIQTSETAATCGNHKFTDSINWSTDGKTATVTRTCANENCKGDGTSTNGGYHKTPLVVSATVTSENQADGSILYTATYEGEVLGTKTVYDLSKAKVVVNGGEAVDTNIYTGESLEEVAPFVVTINGVEIDSELYTIVNQGTKLVPYYYIEGDDDEDDIVPKNAFGIEITAVTDNGAIGSAIGAFNSLGYNTFEDADYKLDGKDYNDLNNSFEYDGKAHPFTVSAVYDGELNPVNLKNVTVEYATVTSTKMAAILKAGNELEVAPTLSYSDKLELTDVVGLDAFGDELPYYVFVKLSADKFTTGYLYAGTVTVERQELPGIAVTITNPTIVYGEQIVATTGDAATDELIGLKVADTTKLGVGRYGIDGTNLITDNGNYAFEENWTNADEFEVKARNATLVQVATEKTYDGNAVDKTTLFDIQGVVNEDNIELVVTTAGNKDILDAGDYTVQAAANNANYTIEKVTGLYTVNPASIAGATVTLAKKSVKYTGKAQKVAVSSVTLADGTKLAASNYTVKYANNKNVGTATVTVTGKGNYTGSAKATFKITKAANTLKVTAVSRTAKAATLKTKAVTVAGIKVSGAQGKVTYRKAKGGSKFTVNKTTGKITIKKGVKAGKYTVTESAQAAGNSNYKKSAVKKAKVTITVK